MKSTLVRLSVLALAFAGFSASTLSSFASRKPVVQHVVVAGTTSAPVCWPGHGVCGMD